MMDLIARTSQRNIGNGRSGYVSIGDRTDSKISRIGNDLPNQSTSVIIGSLGCYGIAARVQLTLQSTP
jgi:hypothetical protein